MKTYYFPDGKYIDAFFGSAEYICCDMPELERLARDWGVELCDLMEQVHEASADEIAEYGVYDS